MTKWWEGQPWRMIQTNLRQIDMQDMDANRYVEDLLTFGPTAVMINTAGIIASYPTKVEGHFQSEYLQGDSLLTVMNACKKAGLKVIARTDFSKIRRPIFEQHPQWAYRDHQNQIVDYNGDVHACINGEFQQRVAFEIIKELCETLPVDGIYINLDGFQTRDYSYNEYGLCHCESCQKRYQAMFGMPIPLKADMNDIAYQNYCAFRREVMRDYRERLIACVRGVRKDIAIDGVDYIRMESNTELGRMLPHWQYSASSNTRCLRGVEGLMVSSNTTVDFVGYYYRHVAVSPALQTLRLWQNVANFGGLDYYLIGRLDNHEDRSGYEGIQKVFAFHRDHEQTLLHMRSMAKVLVLRSYRWTDVAEEQGWIRVLTEAHILFDEGEADRLMDAPFDRYQVIIMPNIEVIADELAQKLDAFAQNGGIVIAVGDAAKYDGEYHERTAPALQCIGMNQKPMAMHDRQSAMFHLNNDCHTLFPSLPQTDVIMCGAHYWYGEYAQEAQRILQFIPPHSYGPPERCYYTHKTDLPGATKHPYGKGYGIYVPWLPGTLYRSEGYHNTSAFMRDLLIQICGVQTVSNATPMVEVTAGIKRDGSYVLIQAVNNSGHFGTSYFEPLVVSNVTVSIPLAQKPVKASRLTSDQSVDWTWEDGQLTVKIESIEWFESIRFDLYCSPD